MLGGLKQALKSSTHFMDAYDRVRFRLRSYHPSRLRAEGNLYFRKKGRRVRGEVIHCGARGDFDKMGWRYRWYFPKASRYYTLDLEGEVDFQQDITNMIELASGRFDCVFAPWVFEHVQGVEAAAREVHRILRPGGDFLFGLPGGVAYHGYPHDYWRFTLGGIDHLLREFDILEVRAVGEFGPGKLDDRLRFYHAASPAVPAGWVGLARKR